MTIKVNTLESPKATLIYNEIVKSINGICAKHDACAISSGVTNTVSGIVIGFRIVGNVEGMSHPIDAEYAYALGFPKMGELAGVSLNDYGRIVSYKGEDVEFIGLIAAGLVEYNTKGYVGHDRLQYVFRGKKFLDKLDKEEALPLLNGEPL